MTWDKISECKISPVSIMNMLILRTLHFWHWIKVHLKHLWKSTSECIKYNLICVGVTLVHIFYPMVLFTCKGRIHARQLKKRVQQWQHFYERTVTLCNSWTFRLLHPSQLHIPLLWIQLLGLESRGPVLSLKNLITQMFISILRPFRCVFDTQCGS